MIAGAIAAMLAAGCSGSSSGDGDAGPGPSGPRPVGEDGGEYAPPLSNGETVTLLETRLTDMDAFLLRGNIPVPPGTFPRADGLQPFTIYDYDGTPLETQTNLVSRYANDSYGADVVEVVARVRSDPALVGDAYTSYEVRQSPRPAAANPGAADLGDLRTTKNLPPLVSALLDDPKSIEIATYDCFGNKYVAYPLDGTGSFRLMRSGLVESEVRVYQTMKPVTPVSGSNGTLPHFFGVHAYLRTMQGEEALGLDLRFNNGHSGADTTTTDDDPLDRVYFSRIEISFPDAWKATQAFKDPMFGATSSGGGRETIAIVEPMSDGTMHVMQWQAQFHRRLLLASDVRMPEAYKYAANSAGQGFCTRGTDPVEGHEYWSWWNRGTSRYFALNYQLPQLDFLGRNNVRNDLANKLNTLSNYLVNGTALGNYPVAEGNLGWAHPYGTSYGGMTGGDEVFIYDGVRVAYSASRQGVQYYKAVTRMHTDRMPTALYNVDGTPSSVEDWVVNDTYVPFQHFVVPSLYTGDPFGVGKAPKFQVNYVVPNLEPAYQARLFSFDPHDYQHYVRYTRGPKVLAWLTNDSLSKDELLMQAENFRLAYHQYDNNQYGAFQQTGLKADQVYTANLPQAGFGFGRGEAWGIDCAVSAYALAEPAWRSKVVPWFKLVANVINDGQAACSGFIQSNVTPKNLNGLYRTRQQIEQSITEAMLQGLRETVFRDENVAYSDMVRDVLADSLYGFVSDMNFMPGRTVPPAISAVGPLDESLPVWCSYSQMPSGSWYGSEAYQDWCSFAWGYELTGDPEFMNKASLQSGGNGNVLQRFENENLSSLNLENRAALLALLQREAGQL